MNFRDLHGMNYHSVEVSHHLATPLSEILEGLAQYLENDTTNEHGNYGVLVSISTDSSPDNEEEFLTTLVWSV